LVPYALRAPAPVNLGVSDSPAAGSQCREETGAYFACGVLWRLHMTDRPMVRLLPAR
jgi:hypothetical protein